MYPVKVDYHGRTEMGERIKIIKETLRAIPNGGIGYGILRYVTRHWGDQGRKAQMVFNYFGQMDQDMSSSQFIRLAQEASGRDFAGTNHHICLMEVFSYVSGGRFYVSWNYSRNRYHDETMQGLLAGFLRNLKAVICYCTQGGNGGYTPSDFPMADLSDEALDQLSTEIALTLEGIE
jgi:non-ribosomal peptide synthase protein (TIGR01720 family)